MGEYDDVDTAIDMILGEGQLCDVCHNEPGSYQRLAGGFIGDDCLARVRQAVDEYLAIHPDGEHDEAG